MHLAPADHLDDVMAVFARLDHLAADLQPDLVDHAQDIALGDRSIRAHDEIRTAQGVEVGGVVGEVKAGVEQLAQLLGGGRRIDVVDRIGGLGGRHVMRFRAHAADAVGEQRHFLHRAPDTKALEAAQLGDLEIGVGDIALFVQEDLDLAVAFQPGDRVDGYSLHRHPPHSVAFPGGFAGAQQRAGQVEAVELPDRVGDAVQDLFDLVRIVAVDHRGEGSHQAGAVIQHAFRRAVAADALGAGLRAERAAAVARGRAVARDALLQQAQLRVDALDILDAHEFLDRLHIARAWAVIADGRAAGADHRPFRGQAGFAVQHFDHQVDHRGNLVRFGRAAGHVVIHRHHLVQRAAAPGRTSGCGSRLPASA